MRVRVCLLLPLVVLLVHFCLPTHAAHVSTDEEEKEAFERDTCHSKSSCAECQKCCNTDSSCFNRCPCTNTLCPSVCTNANNAKICATCEQCCQLLQAFGTTDITDCNAKCKLLPFPCLADCPVEPDCPECATCCEAFVEGDPRDLCFISCHKRYECSTLFCQGMASCVNCEACCGVRCSSVKDGNCVSKCSQACLRTHTDPAPSPNACRPNLCRLVGSCDNCIDCCTSLCTGTSPETMNPKCYNDCALTCSQATTDCICTKEDCASISDPPTCKSCCDAICNDNDVPSCKADCYLGCSSCRKPTLAGHGVKAILHQDDERC